VDGAIKTHKFKTTSASSFALIKCNLNFLNSRYATISMQTCCCISGEKEQEKQIYLNLRFRVESAKSKLNLPLTHTATLSIFLSFFPYLKTKITKSPWNIIHCHLRVFKRRHCYQVMFINKGRLSSSLTHSTLLYRLGLSFSLKKTLNLKKSAK